MSYNIEGIQVLKLDAWMYEEDRIRLLKEHRGSIPEICFLNDSEALEAPDAEGKRKILKFQWQGTFSGNAFWDAFPDVAKAIHGCIEAVLMWEDGEPSGLRILDGRMSEPDVVFGLSEES